MSVYMAGIDHTKADLDTRSVFSFTKSGIENAYDRFRNDPSIDGCILMCTCNRTEIWISSSAEPDPADILCRRLGLDTAVYAPYFTARSGREAVRHLFRVASGLESKIIGEDQIITQVGDSLELARKLCAADRTLEVLFRLAVTAGKQVKTEIVLTTADRSVIHTALEMLEKEGVFVKGKKCMVIGNGLMGKLSAATLAEKGADVTVAVRKHGNLDVSVPDGCTGIAYAERYEKLPQCDLVVSASSSQNHTLVFEEITKTKPARPVYLIDLAVPRDIDPRVRELPWARLYDIDSFNIDPINDNLKQNLQKAESILDEKETEFYRWYDSRDAVPRIQKIKELAGADTAARLSPVMHGLPLDTDEKTRLEGGIEDAVGRMMNRLLFEMRSKLPDGMFRDCLDAMEESLKE